MGVMPAWAKAIDPKTVETLLSGESLSKSALNADLDVVQTPATPAPSAAEAQRQAQLEQDDQTRAEISKLNAADKDTFDKAVGREGPFIDAWNTPERRLR